MKSRKTKNRLPPFLPLLVDMLDAPATKALSHGAFRLYVALKRQYSPNLSDRRNGRVYLSQRRAHQEIRSKRVQIARWYRELEYYGFIVMTAPGCLGPNGKGKAARWRAAGVFSAVYTTARVVTLLLNIPVTIVTPGAWKKAMKVKGGPAGKEECRAKAIQMFPVCAQSFARKKDQGRAEAALLALHAAQLNPRKEAA